MAVRALELPYVQVWSKSILDLLPDAGPCVNDERMNGNAANFWLKAARSGCLIRTGR